jgi:G3E family GTPase
MTPLVLITGFLGAGKTTLMRQLAPLLKANHVDLHCVLNDYGDASIDAETLRDQVASLSDITGSCVCCEGVDELLGTIGNLKPKGRAVIVLEVNGTSDVPSLLELLAMSRSTRHCGPPLQIAIVDTLCWQQRDWINLLEQEQVSAASLVVFTHQDLVTNERVEQVRREFHDINAQAREVSAEGIASRLALQARLATLSQEPNQKQTLIMETPTASPEHHHHHDEDHHGHRFSAIEIALKPRLDRLDFIHTIAALPPTILRAKALVCFEDDYDGLNLVQRADPRADISLIRLTRTKPASSIVVLVGAGMDRAELEQAFATQRLLAA